MVQLLYISCFALLSFKCHPALAHCIQHDAWTDTLTHTHILPPRETITRHISLIWGHFPRRMDCNMLKFPFTPFPSIPSSHKKHIIPGHFHHYSSNHNAIKKIHSSNIQDKGIVYKILCGRQTVYWWMNSLQFQKKSVFSINYLHLHWFSQALGYGWHLIVSSAGALRCKAQQRFLNILLCCYVSSSAVFCTSGPLKTALAKWQLYSVKAPPMKKKKNPTIMIWNKNSLS